FNQSAQTVEDILNKGTATFSWRELTSDKPLTDSDRRAFIEFKPILDYNALEPGKDATDAIRKAAADLDFPAKYQAQVKLTGPIPIANEEYATVQDGAIRNSIGTVIVVLLILWLALEEAARRAAVPLSLAAMATAAGFLCFLPTDYKGISELGEIAGVGMLVAFASSITVLPALLRLLNPPGEKEPVGYAFLAPVDRFLEKHRVIIVVGTLLIPVAGLPLLYFMKFDFNPMNLRNPKAESIATFLDLRKDPNTGANAIDVLTHSEADAKKIEARLEKLPEVLRVQSLASFVPEDQPAKLKLIAQAAKVLN